MANNYLQFSEGIERLSKAEHDWIEETLAGAWLDQGAPPPSLAQELQAAGIDLAEFDPDDWPGFEWDLPPGSDTVWLYSEEGGDVERLASFVRAFLHRFRPDESFSLTWSETCSKLRRGEFGGGAVFVTANAVQIWSAHSWVQQQERQRS